MASPLISVIVLTYNQEGTIGRALDSILEQEGAPDYEIVVSDDESSDGTAAIINRYAEAYPGKFTILKHPRLGLVANYHHALRNARGKYIADCAGDDWWADSRRLARQSAVLEADDNVAAVHSPWREVDWLSGKEIRTVTPVQSACAEAGSLTTALLCREEGAKMHLSATLYRRSVVESAMRERPDLFDAPGRTCEDLPIWIALSRGGKIVLQPEVTLNYSVGAPDVATSLTERRKAARFHLGVLRHTLDLAEWCGTPREKLHPWLKNRLTFILAQLARSFDSGIYDELRRTNAGHRLDLTLKARLYDLVCRIKNLRQDGGLRQ